ncbi:hypothetical protein SLEP1_g16099 [Rubroshorea leprosula]|uniref:Aminotransferase-like plant mobile domain-containing protein n=1 Tax=Rubroshorea leprosula TaxID=152421 RepID=A0AAV5IPM9_9ROSI|nr:hypothetical protein SLEP1_g16099 [Rubroshorea leprosula]
MLVRHGFLHNARLERQDLLPMPIHFAFPSGKTEDWSRWAKEVLANNGFVEVLHAVAALKLVALSQTLQISGNVECLHRLVQRLCTSTHTFILAFGEVTVTLEDVANLMLFPIVGEEDPQHIDLQKMMRTTASVSSPEGVRLPLAPLMLGTLYHMLDLLHFNEILGIGYYIIESHVCLSLLQMFAWERFHPHYFGRVTGGKALKEYPMAKCSYTSGTASFNFHVYKVMPGTFVPPEVSLFDKALSAMLGNQIVNFIAEDLGHMEAPIVVMPSMLLCFTWWGMWSLECYYPKKVARQFDHDQDVPLAPSSDKIDWNKVMWPYIDEVASNMWSEGIATLRFFSLTKMSTMSPLMLEYWRTLLKRFEAFIQSLPKVVEYDFASRDCDLLFTHNNSFLSYCHKHSRGFFMRGNDGQWVPVYLPVLGLVGEEYHAIEGEPGQEVADDAGIGEEANEAAPSRKSALGKRKSIAHPPRSKAHRTSASPTSKQSKAQAPTPSTMRTTKGKGAIDGVPIPGEDEIPSKPEEAKKVKALMVNMEEALANPDVHRKILAKEIAESTTKAKASDISLQKPFTTKGGVRISYGTPSMTKKPGATKTQPETSIPKPRPISELPPFQASNFELVPRGFRLKRKIDAATDVKGVEKGKVTEGEGVGLQGSIDMNRVALEEFESDVGNAAKKPVPIKARDAIDDAESINFKVGTIHTHLSDLAKAYLEKTVFGMAGNDVTESLDEQIERQAKHIIKMEKSLAETKKLVTKLEEGLVLAKAYLGLLNQDKEHLQSNGITELC